MKAKAVVIIPTHKEIPSAAEEISLVQCGAVLSGHARVLVCPEGMNPSRYLSLSNNLEVQPVPAKYLSGVAAYNRFKIGPYLYNLFKDYEYMLTHELDAFVFEDRLDHWCEAGWDYIGAPFFENYGLAERTSPIIGVGNSGFSLRKISSCLKVLESGKPMFSLAYFFNRYRRGLFTPRETAGRLVKHLINRPGFNAAERYYREHEDIFWGDLVPGAFPWFKVADTLSAARFSFEINPPILYEMNSGELPFGCHKWEEIEPEFWKPHIERFGHMFPGRKKPMAGEPKSD